MKKMMKRQLGVLLGIWAACGLVIISQLFISDSKAMDSWPVWGYVGLLLVVLIIAVLTFIMGIKSLLNGYRDFQKYQGSSNFLQFLFTDMKTEDEYVDERAKQISVAASDKSATATESVAVMLFFILFLSNVTSVPSWLIFISGALVYTVRILSYIYIWRKEYLA